MRGVEHTWRWTWTLTLTAVWIGASGCQVDEPAPSEAPTWHQDVAPIAGANCVNCHNEAGIGSFLDLSDYDEAKAWAPLIRTKVAAGEMPPFLAVDTGECENEWGFMNDKRLVARDIDTLLAWVDGGALEGDASTAAPVTVPPIEGLQRVDQEVYAPTPYTTQTQDVIADELICLVLDPELTETRYLEGVVGRPENLAVAHHMVVHVASRTEAAARDAADGNEDGIYPCFGGTGASGALIGGWVPGTGPTFYPEGSALRMDADEVFVVQMHYHNVDTPQTDRSGLQLQWADAAPGKPIQVRIIGNAANAEQGLQPGPNDAGAPTFRIPAGAKGHTETSRHALGVPAGEEHALFMVVPHMHYVGVELRAWIERADGSPGPCLMHTPSWDFDWQLFYYYDAAADNAPIARPGDTLVIECTYDNTTDNEGVQRIMEEEGLDQPEDVLLGDGSLYEMCILAIGSIPR